MRSQHTSISVLDHCATKMFRRTRKKLQHMFSATHRTCTKSLLHATSSTDTKEDLQSPVFHFCTVFSISVHNRLWTELSKPWNNNGFSKRHPVALVHIGTSPQTKRSLQLASKLKEVCQPLVSGSCSLNKWRRFFGRRLQAGSMPSMTHGRTLSL